MKAVVIKEAGGPEKLVYQWYLEDFDPIMDIAPNSYLTSCYSGNVDEKKINRMLDYGVKYKVDARPEKVFDLAHVADAHRYLEGQNSFGKVVVVEKDKEE